MTPQHSFFALLSLVVAVLLLAELLPLLVSEGQSLGRFNFQRAKFLERQRAGY